MGWAIKLTLHQILLYDNIKKAKNGAKTDIYDVTHIDIGCHQDYRFVTDIEKLDKVSLILTSFNVLLMM